MEDLEIVCTDCHPKADEKRRYNQAIETYMTKRYGEDWESRFTVLEATRQFQRWLLSKEQN